LSNKNFKNTEL